MPAGKGLRLHNGQRLTPVEPATEPDQGDTSGIGRTPGFDVALLIQRQLFTQKEIFGCQGSGGRRQSQRNHTTSASRVSSVEANRMRLSRRRNRGVIGKAPFGHRVSSLPIVSIGGGGASSESREDKIFADHRAGMRCWQKSQMPVTSTLLDQAHNAIERKLCAMKGFHPPGGSQQALLTELAHLYTLVPYQRRPSTPGNAGWKWKAGEYPPRTGSSTSKSSPLEAFDE